MFETKAGSLLAAWLTLILLAQIGECAYEQNSVLDYVIHHPSLHQHVREALLALELPQPATPEQITQQILLKARGNDLNHHIYKSLSDLIVTPSDSCPSHAVICCISIMTQEELKPFREFVEHYRDKFYKCAEKAIDVDIEQYMMNLGLSPDLFASFEAFLRGAMDYYDGEGDYLERLKKLDLFDAKLNAKRMLTEADKHNLSTAEDQGLGLSSSTKIERFLNSRCFPFYAALRGPFGVINLAALLEHHPPYDDLTLKMNEYNRICVAWFKESSRKEILSNINWKAPINNLIKAATGTTEASAPTNGCSRNQNPKKSKSWWRRYFCFQ